MSIDATHLTKRGVAETSTRLRPSDIVVGELLRILAQRLGITLRNSDDAVSHAGKIIDALEREQTDLERRITEFEASAALVNLVSRQLTKTRRRMSTCTPSRASSSIQLHRP